ncbi:MAG: hypothetical protein LBF74_08780 [Treponema sp.]|jgi:hypothetical protein|nr:hypothetical protein [Treponema sp.]
MKRDILFTILFAGLIGLFFIACDNPAGTSGEPGSPIESIPNSDWSDTLNPETTLTFTATGVTLGGEPSSASDDKNWYWGAALDGQNFSIDIVEDTDAILALLDQVEDNWGTNYTTLPDAVIVVWTDTTKNIGFQLHYYAKGSGKSYERLVCWGIGQPHEFTRNP